MTYLHMQGERGNEQFAWLEISPEIKEQELEMAGKGFWQACVLDGSWHL